jgi:MFS transporter, ACS family, D-galactonate transporter
MTGMAVGSGLLVLGVLATQPAWIVTWFALALGAVGMSEGPFWVTAIDLGGRRGGSSAAFFNTGGNIGGLLAPFLTPRVGRHFGWGFAVALGALVCLAGVLLWLGVDTTKALPFAGPPDQEEGPALPADVLRTESTS